MVFQQNIVLYFAETVYVCIISAKYIEGLTRTKKQLFNTLITTYPVNIVRPASARWIRSLRWVACLNTKVLLAEGCDPLGQGLAQKVQSKTSSTSNFVPFVPPWCPLCYCVAWVYCIPKYALRHRLKSLRLPPSHVLIILPAQIDNFLRQLHQIFRLAWVRTQQILVAQLAVRVFGQWNDWSW